MTTTSRGHRCGRQQLQQSEVHHGFAWYGMFGHVELRLLVVAVCHVMRHRCTWRRQSGIICTVVALIRNLVQAGQIVGQNGNCKVEIEYNSYTMLQLICFNLGLPITVSSTLSSSRARYTMAAIRQRFSTPLDGADELRLAGMLSWAAACCCWPCWLLVAFPDMTQIRTS